MVCAAWILTIALGLQEAPSVAGHVVGPDGKGVAQARVYLERGDILTGQVAGADGGFRFDAVESGISGLFAVSPGMAYGGTTINTGLGENISDLTLRLGEPDTVGGKVVDPKGKPVAGARITGIALLGETKVGIPLGKLEKDGIKVPVTGPDGRFVIPFVPKGQPIAVKVNHVAFAQGAAGNIVAGEQNAKIALSPGVLVRGNVLTRDRSAAVMNATITIKNSQPPYDSLTTVSGPSGTFELRLKPGMYLCQAVSAQYRSPGWEEIGLTGEQAEQKVTLRLASMVPIHGKVFDAVSGGPVVGARVALISNGMNAAVALSGPTGEYQLTAVEGDNAVKLESAPGYQPPTNPALGVTAASGQTVEMPDFWLAPTPSYKVQIVDENGQGVPGVVLRVLRPEQFGWHVTDAQGHASVRVLSTPPEGGLVVMAEHPTKALGAVFALKRANDPEVKAPLLPLSPVQGRTVDATGKPLAGCVVGALFADDTANETMLLWRTVSRDDGTFEWLGGVPYLPLRCLAYAGAQASGESATFNPKPGAEVDAGTISISNGTPGTSVRGKPLKWYDNKPLCGEIPKKSARSQAAVVVYCNGQDAPAVIDALTQARQIAGAPGIFFAVVVSGQYTCGAQAIPVLSGAAPATATTYLVDSEGKVALETFGLPPISALHGLVRGSSPR